MDAFSLEDQSFIHDRTAELAEQHRKYLEQHPELTQLLHDFVTNCLVNKVRASAPAGYWFRGKLNITASVNAAR
jgi:hypothetical protein